MSLLSGWSASQSSAASQFRIHCFKLGRDSADEGSSKDQHQNPRGEERPRRTSRPKVISRISDSRSTSSRKPVCFNCVQGTQLSQTHPEVRVGCIRLSENSRKYFFFSFSDLNRFRYPTMVKRSWLNKAHFFHHLRTASNRTFRTGSSFSNCSE